jgi:hypothetical protein
MYLNGACRAVGRKGGEVGDIHSKRRRRGATSHVPDAPDAGDDINRFLRPAGAAIEHDLARSAVAASAASTARLGPHRS